MSDRILNTKRKLSFHYILLRKFSFNDSDNLMKKVTKC